ncbi:UNVERIFIED_CONTAM: hypothetical protein HDU68_010674 [Siphonaria sp. JEL0065]|nr:hypothetical protein HDU68_010674 [Siphonaria sp. JEL0065]
MKSPFFGIKRAPTSTAVPEFQAFIGQNIQVYGTIEKPLFKAIEIAELLELADVRTSMRGPMWEKDRSQAMVLDARGYYQLTTMVNTTGLFHLIFRSTKAEAMLFKDWQQLDQQHQLIDQFELEKFQYVEVRRLEKQKRQTSLLTRYGNDKGVFYLTRVTLPKFSTRIIVKYGHTGLVREFKERVKDHLRGGGFQSFELFGVFSSVRAQLMEHRFRKNRQIEVNHFVPPTLAQASSGEVSVICDEVDGGSSSDGGIELGVGCGGVQRELLEFIGMTEDEVVQFTLNIAKDVVLEVIAEEAVLASELDRTRQMEVRLAELALEIKSLEILYRLPAEHQRNHKYIKVCFF